MLCSEWRRWGGAELAPQASFILSKAELVQKGDHRGLSKQNLQLEGDGLSEVWGAEVAGIPMV